ncbi:nucleoside hydrolase [Niveomyces insectorum RCEF 264]|uniref:Nucleoside hydrolase n=1 Tax=Niveomyces insectorum RCEF 264 TaxID=1081102 RepID=A0A167WZQ1_9HYPO|nr:nucleoside hydrolase [Niveomyces insectorum RCEF 264]
MKRTATDVLIDCDPGIDDSVAILYALSSPDIRIRAITTVSGNLQAASCAQNALKILTLCGKPEAAQIPVARGRQTPLVRPYPKDPFSHGADGLGELGIPPSTLDEDKRFAPDVIIDTAEAVSAEPAAGSKKLTILCLGPLTNLALAVMKDPLLPSKVDRVICIAGSFGFHTTGTARSTGDNPVSEWNVYVDPEAADIVFNAGFNLFALGLDVATQPDVEFSPKHLAQLERAKEAGNPAAQFLLGVIDWGHSLKFDTWCTTIDSTAVAVALDPSVVTFEEVRVAVETTSKLSLGQIIVDRREKFCWTHLPVIKAASDIDAIKFLDSLVDTICLPAT